MKKAVTGLRLVHVQDKTAVREVREIREATTGRVLSVPRIWAVAAPVRVVKRAGVEDANAGAVQAQAETKLAEPKVELGFYRKYTEAMLRRYLRTSMEAGRVPSLMGREMFRGQVTSYKVKSFEDAVIFCIDVERCLARLRRQDQQLIQRIALQNYTQGEAAPLVGLSLRQCVRAYGRAVDRLTEMFLEAGLLRPLGGCL
ncbi:MAG TPA: hypothetical protein VHY48_02110 [Acidobacteriaceae bacterium]|nr:hypothetical protein [Acidobacteriaceae bacterium]